MSNRSSQILAGQLEMSSWSWYIQMELLWHPLLKELSPMVFSHPVSPPKLPALLTVLDNLLLVVLPKLQIK